MRGSLVALGITVLVGAVAVVVPLAVVDRTADGTPIAAEIPFSDPVVPGPEEKAPLPTCDGQDQLVASGSSLAEVAVTQVMDRYLALCPDRTMTYDPVGNGAGVQAFTLGETALAVTDKPVDTNALGGRCDARQLPFVVQPVTLRYHLTGVDDLTLDAPTLTKIFTGAITQWNDPAIAALNPGTALGALPIMAVSRSDESGATLAFQQYLAAAGGWTGGTDATFTGRSSQAVKGNSGMLTAVDSIDGAIGYLLPEESRQSSVVRLGGVAPDQTAMTATVTAALPGEGLALDPADLYGANPADGAYPLVMVGYALFCAGDAAVRDFLLASLTLEGGETTHLLPTGEWALRLADAVQ